MAAPQAVITGTQARLVDHLREDPGLRAPDLARRLDIHPTTAEYHLRRLTEQGKVQPTRCGRQLHYYEAGTGWCPRTREVHAALTPAGRTLLEIALGQGMVARREVAAVGHSRSAVRWAVERFQEVGVLEKATWGIYVLADGCKPCVRAALAEGVCRGCNPGASTAAFL